MTEGNVTDGLDSESAATAVLSPSDAAQVARPSDCCPKCSTPIDARRNSWCGRCGFYPRLGTFVELDNPEPAAEEEQPAQSGSALREVPTWVWILFAGFVVLLVISAVARFLTAPDSASRTSWALGQFGIGALVAAVAHVLCYIAAMMESDQLNILDIILRPLTLWTFALKEMPGSFRRVAAGCWGLFAAFLAVTVVGIPFAELFDWGGEPAKVSLVHAITEHAGGQDANDQSMDEAIKSFAGQSGADKLKDRKTDEQAFKRTKSVDCLILGFVADGDDDFSALVLATVINKQLKFVGSVSDGIAPEVRSELNEKMRTMRREQPFVSCKLPAVWLEPTLVCRVRFSQWTASKQLSKPMFEKMLAEVDKAQ